MSKFREAYSPKTGDRLLFFKMDDDNYIFKLKFIKTRMTTSLYIITFTFAFSLTMMLGLIFFVLREHQTDFGFRFDSRMIFPMFMVGMVTLLFLVMGFWMIKRIFGKIKVIPSLGKIIIGNTAVYNRKLEINSIISVKYSLKPYGKYKRLTPTVSLVRHNKKELNILVIYDQQLAQEFASELSDILNKKMIGE